MRLLWRRICLTLFMAAFISRAFDIALVALILTALT
jgi:hypothetical protein